MSEQKMTVARFHLIRFAVVIIVALIVAAGFALTGIYLSKALGHARPWLSFVLVVISFPITQLILFKLMRHMGNKFLNR